MKTPMGLTDWNASLYDDKHSFVFKYGEDLVELLRPQNGERILDLGCGTGYLTSIIAASGAHVVGIDSSLEMVTKAKAAYPQLDFQVQNATDFHFDEHFDAVFSNAVLHWIIDKEKTVDCIYNNLKRHGRFVMEMGGRNNVVKIIKAMQKSLLKNGFVENAAMTLWYFPSLGEYTSLLESKGFKVTYAIYYDRETKLNDDKNGIKDWLKMFAGNYFNGIEESRVEDILNEVQAALEPTNYINGSWYADYKRLRLVAFK
ncbi:MAG TPA: class I SAM-dependent methyltransferase [Ginsengibacter sp.]